MQKFSIKEISRLETAIDEEVNYLKDRNCKHLRSEYNTTEEAIKGGAAATKSLIEAFSELVAVKFHIREIKQEFNASNGINDKTREIALLEQTRDMYQDLSNISYPQQVANYSTSRVAYRTGISDHEKDALRTKVKQLSRQITRLKDSCQGINNQGKIELDTSAVATLVKFGILDA